MSGSQNEQNRTEPNIIYSFKSRLVFPILKLIRDGEICHVKTQFVALNYLVIYYSVLNRLGDNFEIET